MTETSGSGELTVVYGNYTRNMIVKKILDLITKSGKLLKNDDRNILQRRIYICVISVFTERNV